MENNATMWGIHSHFESIFLDENVVAIGWEKMGDMRSYEPTREAMRNAYMQAYPNEKKMTAVSCSGSIYRFVCVAKVGDLVVYPSRRDRKINIGVIESDLFYAPNELHYHNRRKVKWLKHFPREMFPQAALYEVGSALTFFQVKNHTNDFLKALEPGFNGKQLATIKKKNPSNSGVSIDQEDESISELIAAKSVEDTTRDYIRRILSEELKGYALEDFVKNLLEAMGYKAEVSLHGGDHGIDIIAYKDELPPRILVQVKSIDGDIKEAMIQSLKGAMKEGDYGVFVTLSDYTKNARKYLESTPIIRGINGAELIDLVLKYYERLDKKYKELLSLRMVYAPDLAEENE